MQPQSLFTLLFLASLTSAANPTSFCKCTCGTESEIIALDPRSTTNHHQLLSSRSLTQILPGFFRPRQDKEGAEQPVAVLEAQPQGNGNSGGDSEEGGGEGDIDNGGKKHPTLRAKTCNDCNRQLCLSYNLPQCRTVREEEVFTQCFQRDSAKDEAIVYGFIVLTGSLLSWALLRPWVEKWMQHVKSRSSYAPVVNENER